MQAIFIGVILEQFKEIVIPYSPHPKQLEIHSDSTRFKIVAAGRRSGKTVLAINELIKQALTHPEKQALPVQRSWYICETYRQAEMIAWKTFLKFCPEELILTKNVNKLQVELINGHNVEFKGSEDPDKLRGVPLVFVILDEFGNMKPEVWTDVIRASLVDARGRALFIGTPAADGSPHFSDLFNHGNMGDKSYKSWLFYTLDNPHIPPEEVAEARRNLPPDIFKREFEANFSISSGIIYDNFKNTVHVVPNYEPDYDDFVVGSIDPGLMNATAAILCAWRKDGSGVIFKEYYQKELLATENAQKIYELARPYKVAYWIIDRASKHRDQASGMTVFQKYQDVLKPLFTSPNDPNTVWAGIDEVKKLFHVNEETGRPRLQVTAQCSWWLWEVARYTRYKHKWHVEKNEVEAPRKLNDHLMDATRNMVYSKPWLRKDIRLLKPLGVGYG